MKKKDPGKKAFSLIEMLGVVAIIAVLASVLLPSVVRQVDRANYTKETSNLSAFAEAISRSVTRTRTVPAGTNLAAAIAAEATLPLIQVVSNSLGVVRGFIMDPGISLPRGGVSGVPYNQTTTVVLSNAPSNVRAIIVSSVSRSYP